MNARPLDLDLYSDAFRSRITKCERPVASYGRRYLVTAPDADAGATLDIRSAPGISPTALLVWDCHRRELAAVVHNDCGA